MNAIVEFIRKNCHPQFGKPSIDVSVDAEWEKIRATGTRLWLDTGDIDEAGKLWNRSFEALTTNNTLLNKEIQKGIYDQLIPDAAKVVLNAESSIHEQKLVLEIAFILNAYHALRLVEKFDAFVSVELHTDLAHDVGATVAYGKRYYALCPERFIVKVPLTPAGFLSARQLVREGIPINFTLGFSARQNYLAALLTQPAYVNVFMGRLNSFVVDNQLGTGENIGEKTTLATQRELLALRHAGRTKSFLIGASIRSGAQIGALAGCDVLTMPTKAAAEYRAHPQADVQSHVATDPEVVLHNGVTFSQFNATTLWDVPVSFKAAVESLLRGNLDQLTPEALQAHFPEDFLPHWTPAELAMITQDGKIPVAATWSKRLAAGELGLDALMNVSALQAFVVDQNALDHRIRSVLKSAGIF